MPPAEPFDLTVTRGEMAALLGLTIETVSRQLTALERDGIIRRNGCARHRAGRRRAAGECGWLRKVRKKPRAPIIATAIAQHRIRNGSNSTSMLASRPLTRPLAVAMAVFHEPRPAERRGAAGRPAASAPTAPGTTKKAPMKATRMPNGITISGLRKAKLSTPTKPRNIAAVAMCSTGGNSKLRSVQARGLRQRHDLLAGRAVRNGSRRRVMGGLLLLEPG